MPHRPPSAIAAALDARDELVAPSMRGPIFGVLAAIGIAVILGVVFASPTHASSQFQEGGGITALSAFFMATAAGMSFGTFYFCRAAPRFGRWFWLLAGMGFSYFALDETLQFHERMGFALGDSEGKGPWMFRNWNDIIVIGYGLVAIVVCAVFLPELLRYRKFSWLVAIAGAAYVLHTGIDSVFERADRSVMIEETAKLTSAGFFALSFFSAMVATAHETLRAPVATPQSGVQATPTAHTKRVHTG